MRITVSFPPGATPVRKKFLAGRFVKDNQLNCQVCIEKDSDLPEEVDTRTIFSYLMESTDRTVMQIVEILDLLKIDINMPWEQYLLMQRVTGWHRPPNAGKRRD